MTPSEQIQAARDQLNRTLSFFPRIDSKASVILAVATSMLGLLAARVGSNPPTGLQTVAPIVCVLALLAVFWHLYHQAFPQLDGGKDSLLYFKEIATKREAAYVKSWKEMSSGDYLDDLLCQVWRNSDILQTKFHHLRLSMICLAIALVPWLYSIAALAWARRLTTIVQ